MTGVKRAKESRSPVGQGHELVFLNPYFHNFDYIAKKKLAKKEFSPLPLEKTLVGGVASNTNVVDVGGHQTAVPDMLFTK